MPDLPTEQPAVRRATLADVDAVRAVGRATWPATYGPLLGEDYVAAGLARWWSVEQVTRGITVHTTYVAEDVDGVVGCAIVGVLDDLPMLWKLYVLPCAQGGGAGRALLDAVIAGLPPEAQVLRLDHAADNTRAHEFYVSQRFADVGPHGEGPDREMRMERRLDR